MSREGAGTGPTREEGFAVKALLLDLDGTILDTAQDLATATNRTLWDLGRTMVGEDQVRTWIGDGVRALVRQSLEATGGCDNGLLDRAHERFMEHYGDCFADASRPYPGVVEALGHFREAGLPLAVITNKAAAFTEPLLEATGIRPFLDAVVSGDQVSRKKPDPEPVRRALELLGADPVSAVLVGDSANDVTAGLEAGCRVIAVSYGYNRGQDPHRLGADRVVETFGDVAGLLLLPQTRGD